MPRESHFKDIWLYVTHFSCFFGSKGQYMSSKIKIFSQNLTHFVQFEGSFLEILGKKKSFSRIFQSFLGVV